MWWVIYSVLLCVVVKPRYAKCERVDTNTTSNTARANIWDVKSPSFAREREREGGGGGYVWV